MLLVLHGMGQSTVMSSLKAKLGSSAKLDDDDFIGNNLLKVEIYFKDFITDDIAESPAYPVSQSVAVHSG